MISGKTTIAVGRRVYGLGVMIFGMVSLTTGDFVLGQPVSAQFPHRVAAAYIVGAFMLGAGFAIQWRRTATWGSAAITAYYVFFVVIVMNGRLMLTHYDKFISYSGTAEQLAITIGGLIAYVSSLTMNEVLASRLLRLGQFAFGVCLALFGLAHFIYLDLTAPLVPKWLPPSQKLWAYATGASFLAASVSILTGVQARLAAVLLTVMLASFALLVHTPLLVADFSNPMNWTESAVNLAMVGTAWMVAESLARRNLNAALTASERDAPSNSQALFICQR